jgi:diguanylate cyclase (GGDEF)-like protein
MIGSPHLKSTPISDQGQIELITMLISGRLPIAVMAATVVIVTICQQIERWDPWTLSIGTAIVVLLIARAVIVTAFIRDEGTAPMTSETAHKWEVRFVKVVISYAALLGMFNFHIAATGSEAVRLLVVAETYGFCAGMVSRGFVRPQLCALMVLTGALPTTAGMIARAADTEGVARITYTVVGALFVIYAISSLETVQHLYRAMLAQLATKHELACLAREDPLTGLPNRLAMRERLASDAEQKHGSREITLLLIDLDGFKAVNDKFGHPAGDRLLCEVARRLSDTLRADDLAIRIGGDEFAIIQTGRFSRKLAEAHSIRLIAALTAPYEYDGLSICIGASIGIATDDGKLANIDLLFEHADSALYRAKRYGGNAFRFWQNEPQLTIAA